MKNTQNILIVMLLVTAAFLSALLVGQFVYTEKTAVAATHDREGDYIIVSGTFDQDKDVVYVLDIANAKVNLYYPDVNTNSLVLGTTLDLSKEISLR